MRWLILALAAIPAFALWAWVVFVGTSHGWWREPLAPPGDSQAFFRAARDDIDANNHGNAAFRLLEAGAVVGEHDVSIGTPVTAHTRFQVGSLSKWITAWGVMHLMEAGKLDLDAPVSGYLTRWRLPETSFDNDAVTVRRLLSHTAGLTDGLGYGGFPPGTDVQPLEASLTQATDALGNGEGRTRVGLAPGSEWRYSGGGYGLLQLVIEEVSGQSFEAYMRQSVLDPLGLDRSTFVLDDSAPNLATFYDVDGTPASHFRFSAPSAAGLYTTAADMSAFLQAQLPGANGESAGRGVLQPDTLALMRQPHASALGTDIWGLGHMLYAETASAGHVIGHDGSNRPAISSSVRLDPDTGDGIVLLSTGNTTLASRLAGEWVFWHTGKLDIGMFYDATRDMVITIAVGWGLIILAVLVLGWLATRQRRRGNRLFRG
jgi:CubicO group peptidase (beta-lactamase class C family)